MIMKINWTHIACLSLTILTGCSGDDIFAPDHIWSAGKQGGLLVTNRDKKEIYLIDANFNKTGTKAVLPGISLRSVHLCCAPGGQIQFVRQLMDISSTGLIGGSSE